MSFISEPDLHVPVPLKSLLATTRAPGVDVALPGDTERQFVRGAMEATIEVSGRREHEAPAIGRRCLIEMPGGLLYWAEPTDVTVGPNQWTACFSLCLVEQMGLADELRLGELELENKSLKRGMKAIRDVACRAIGEPT